MSHSTTLPRVDRLDLVRISSSATAMTRRVYAFVCATTDWSGRLTLIYLTLFYRWTDKDAVRV